MVEGAFFIGLVIVAVTEGIKLLVPKVNGAVTIFVAAVIGVLVALLDVQIGVEDLTVAQGLLIGLSASGVVTVATKFGNTQPSGQ